MKFIISWIFALQFHSIAFATDVVDHLANFQPFGGSKFFCNVLERAKKQAETNTACSAIILLEKSDVSITAIENGTFGLVLQQSELGKKQLLVVSFVTIEQLEDLRYDARIKALVPDFSLGGVGSFTVKN